MDRIARIREWHPGITFSLEEAARLAETGRADLAELINVMLTGGHRTPGESHGVMLLSPVDDPATVRLNQPVLNDTVTATGRPWAWTLGQRYTQLDRLRTAVRTSDL